MEVGTEIGQPNPVGPGMGSGVIVPPVIVQPTGQDSGFGLQGLHDLYIQAIGDTMAQWQTVYGPIADLLPNLIQQQQTAGAGGPPPTVAQQPLPPVVIVQPPAPQAPAPVPAPTGPSCPSSYPNHNPSRGTPGANSCYKNCGHCDKNSQNGKWYRNHGHCYQNGTRVHLNNEYPGGCP